MLHFIIGLAAGAIATGAGIYIASAWHGAVSPVLDEATNMGLVQDKAHEPKAPHQS